MGSVANPWNGTFDEDGVIGVPWYTQSEYAATLAVMEDSGLFPDNYTSWHLGAQELLQRLESVGVTALIVVIDAKDFLQWCHKQDVRADAEARMEYVKTVIARLQGDPGSQSPALPRAGADGDIPLLRPAQSVTGDLTGLVASLFTTPDSAV